MGKNLVIHQISAENLYRESGKALIGYDLSVLRSQLDLFLKAFQSVGRLMEVAYSYKTNPLLADTLHHWGCKMEVTGKTHLHEALKFCHGNEIILMSPTLDDALIAECLHEKVHIIADSIQQLEKINKMAKSHVKVGLRLNTCVESKNPLCASGSSFGLLGVSEKEFLSQLEKIKTFKNVELIGIHNHFASQNTDLSSWRKNAEHLVKVASLVEGLHYVNIGGGFSIDYQDNAPQIEKVVQALFGPLFNLPEDVHVVTEPGRFLAGPCGILLAEVVAVKKDLVNTAFLNTSIFSTFPDRLLSGFAFNPSIQIVNKINKKGKNTFYIRGSSPSSVDFFGTIKDSPTIREGDIIAIKNVGAYGTAQASSFCGAEKPLEYLIDDAVVKCVGIRE